MKARNVFVEQFPEFKCILLDMLNSMQDIINDDSIKDKECRLANLLNNVFK